MRSSPETLRVSDLLRLALIFLAACATVPPAVAPAPAPTQAAPVMAPAPVPSLAQVPLDTLEHREFESPRDPAVKMELARRHWCVGAHGIALEHWLWVRQFSPKSPEAAEAARLAALARRDASVMTHELHCQEP